METKLECLLYSGNTLNMFEIQKYLNRIFQRDEYFHSKKYCLTLDLLCTAELGMIYFFKVCFCLQIISLFRFVGF